MDKEKKFMVVVNCKNKGKIKISNKNTLLSICGDSTCPTCSSINKVIIKQQ